MAEAFRRSPLEARADDLARLGGRELPFLRQLAVRTDRPGALELPTEPNTWTASDDPVPREALWLGPDEWLVLGPPGSATGFHHGASTRSGSEDPLARTVRGAASVVDVSANRAVIELVRDHARSPSDLVEQGCSIDLDPRSWRAGMCAQTLLAHVLVILQEREGATRILVRPSYADWLVDWLLAVA